VLKEKPNNLKALITFLCIALVGVCRAEPASETVTIETQGIGKDAQAAEKNALYLAVERAVGTYLDNETVVKNEEVIHDKLLTVAQGFVQKYDVLVPPQEKRDGSGTWVIKIRAVVKKSEVGAALRTAGVMSAAVDGTAAWATQITKVKNREDAMALLEKVIPSIPRNLVMCSLTQQGGKMEISEDLETGEQLVVVRIRVDLNLNWWVKEAVPALDAAFTALSLQNGSLSPITRPSKVYSKSEVRAARPPGLPDFRSADGMVKHQNQDKEWMTLSQYLRPNHRWYESCQRLNQEAWRRELRGLMAEDDYWFEDWEISNRDIADRCVEIVTEVNKNLKSIEYKSKRYAIPETWRKNILSLWDRRMEKVNPSFVVIFKGDDAKTLCKIPFVSGSFGLIHNDWGWICPAFEAHSGSGSLTGGYLLTLKLAVPADVLKSTKKIELNAGVFGIAKTPPTSSSSNPKPDKISSAPTPKFK
jgi:hypothetical protein